MNKKIKKQVEDLLIGRERIKRTTTTRMQQAEKDAEQARREMEQATRKDDEAAFIKAADKERFNQSIIENCKQTLNRMESVPEEEARAMLQQIQEAQDEIIDAAESKAAAAVKTICEVAQAAEKEIDELQELANRYANATGNGAQVTPFMKRNSDILGLYATICANKARKQQAGTVTKLYNNL